MILRELSFDKIFLRLRGPGLVLDTGAFKIHLRTDVKCLAEMLVHSYGGHKAAVEPTIHHLRLRIVRGPWRGPGRDRGVRAFVNDRPILGPFPTYLAYPMLESILNWSIAKLVLRFVVFHAGAVERDGHGLILTGPSGSGKSTLCAALSQTGWRLLSDEMVLLRPAGPAIAGNPRPISLKNDAIARIRDVAPAATFTDAYEGTVRGTISFVCPTADSVVRAAESAPPSRVVFPRFQSGAETEIKELERAQGFIRLIENSVNYVATLRTGFEAVADLTERCRFYEITFGDLDAAMAAIETIAAPDPGDAAAA